jgi:IS4 transposase
MLWALWMDAEHRGAKLHLQYEVLKAVPVRAELTEARVDDRGILQKSLEAGRLYVLDRGFADYGLFEDILQAQSSFVCRIYENAAFEERLGRPLSGADQAAGVVSDCVGRLGSASVRRAVSVPLRIVEVHRWQDNKLTVLRLATDRMDLPADLIALIYQHRWTIELFFRWMKCTLKVRHLFSESRNGMHIQVYAALIATLLMALYTGLKPNKAIHELFCFYLQGWATFEELTERIGKLKAS